MENKKVEKRKDESIPILPCNVIENQFSYAIICPTCYDNFNYIIYF